MGVKKKGYFFFFLKGSFIGDLGGIGKLKWVWEGKVEVRNKKSRRMWWSGGVFGDVKCMVNF